MTITEYFTDLEAKAKQALQIPEICWCGHGDILHSGRKGSCGGDMGECSCMNYRHHEHHPSMTCSPDRILALVTWAKLAVEALEMVWLDEIKDPERKRQFLDARILLLAGHLDAEEEKA